MSDHAAMDAKVGHFHIIFIQFCVRFFMNLPIFPKLIEFFAQEHPTVSEPRAKGRRPASGIFILGAIVSDGMDRKMSPG